MARVEDDLPEADVVALIAALRRIQELATDTPHGTLAEAQAQLDAIFEACETTLSVSVQQD